MLILLIIAAESIGDDFLRRIFASYDAFGSENRNYGNRFEHVPYRTTRTSRPRGRSYKEICRAVSNSFFLV